MKTHKLLMYFLVFVLAACFVSGAYAQEKIKPEKVSGKVIVNLKENYVKVIGEDYKVHKILLQKKTQVEATVKAKVDDLAIAREGGDFPEGTVSYIMKDGNPVAEKITYKSKASWGIKKKKKKKADD